MTSFHQWEGKWLTRSFGWTYDLPTGRSAPGEPVSRWLAQVRSHAADFAGIAPDALEQASLMQHGIGWHRGRPVFEHVIGLRSLR